MVKTMSIYWKKKVEIPIRSLRSEEMPKSFTYVAKSTGKSQKGFTLIEMLVVMAVVALLLSIALPRYFGSLEKSKEVALKENLQTMRTGIDKFYADKGHYPETLEDLVTEKYFRAVPADPVTESTTTWILIPSKDADSPGVMDIKSGAQGKTRDGKLYENL